MTCDKPIRFLGLDFGDKTIGVAVACPDSRVATGVTTLLRDDPLALRASLKALKTFIKSYGITHVVLGYPLYLDGTPSAQSVKTAAFKEKLERYIKTVVVNLWDERLSTQAVSRVISNRDKIDEMAAVYILQGYLDARNRSLKSY